MSGLHGSPAILSPTRRDVAKEATTRSFASLVFARYAFVANSFFDQKAGVNSGYYYENWGRTAISANCGSTPILRGSPEPVQCVVKPDLVVEALAGRPAVTVEAGIEQDAGLAVR